MKLFIYKLIISLVFLYIFFEFTIGTRLDYYKDSLNSLGDQQKRLIIKEKVKTELRKAIKKENYFTEEERILISGFIKKIQNELNASED
jgi:hypothetical protein